MKRIKKKERVEQNSIKSWQVKYVAPLSCGLILIFVCVILSGCSYWRLWRTANQFNGFENFEKNFELKIAFVFKNPKLWAKDVSWLMMDSPPDEKIPQSQDSELWNYTLNKRCTRTKSKNFDIVLGMKMKSGKLHEVIFPKIFTRYLTAEVLEEIMNSTVKDGNGLSSVKSIDFRSYIPTSAAAISVLGFPSHRENSTEGEIFTYIYSLTRRNPEGNCVFFEAILIFNKQTKELERLIFKHPSKAIKEMVWNFIN